MRRTIPQIRDRLHELADEHGIEELHELAEETKRRSPVRRARARRLKLTDDMRREIVELAEAFPDASYDELNETLNVGIGRISEALAGFR